MFFFVCLGSCLGEYAVLHSACTNPSIQPKKTKRPNQHPTQTEKLQRYLLQRKKERVPLLGPNGPNNPSSAAAASRPPLPNRPPSAGVSRRPSRCMLRVGRTINTWPSSPSKVRHLITPHALCTAHPRTQAPSSPPPPPPPGGATYYGTNGQTPPYPQPPPRPGSSNSNNNTGLRQPAPPSLSTTNTSSLLLPTAHIVHSPPAADAHPLPPLTTSASAPPHYQASSAAPAAAATTPAAAAGGAISAVETSDLVGLNWRDKNYMGVVRLFWGVGVGARDWETWMVAMCVCKWKWPTAFV